jgi:hypothetical protein
MENENKAPKTGWRLKNIEIKFEKGYSFNEKEEEKHDRYVGNIVFENEDGESFNLKIPTDMTTRYMDLMREDIVKTAETLGAKIADSIRLVDEN